MLLSVVEELFVIEANTEPEFEGDDAIASCHEVATITDDLKIGGEFILCN